MLTKHSKCLDVFQLEHLFNCLNLNMFIVRNHTINKCITLFEWLMQAFILEKKSTTTALL